MIDVQLKVGQRYAHNRSGLLYEIEEVYPNGEFRVKDPNGIKFNINKVKEFLRMNTLVGADDKPVPPPPTEFKVGDVVRLKSGGPAMTVGGHSRGTPVSVTWHLADGRLESALILPQLLVLQLTPDDSMRAAYDEICERHEDEKLQRGFDAMQR